MRLTFGFRSTRAVLNHAIMVEAQRYCVDQKLDISEEQLATLFEIFASEYNIDEDTVSYNITVE